jgi:hypothetical protein
VGAGAESAESPAERTGEGKLGASWWAGGRGTRTKVQPKYVTMRFVTQDLFIFSKSLQKF